MSITAVATGITLLVLHGAVVIGGWKQRRKNRSPACSACGYSRIGLAVNRCPECGHKFSKVSLGSTRLWISPLIWQCAWMSMMVQLGAAGLRYLPGTVVIQVRSASGPPSSGWCGEIVLTLERRVLDLSVWSKVVKEEKVLQITLVDLAGNLHSHTITQVVEPRQLQSHISTLVENVAYSHARPPDAELSRIYRNASVLWFSGVADSWAPEFQGQAQATSATASRLSIWQWIAVVVAAIVWLSGVIAYRSGVRLGDKTAKGDIQNSERDNEGQNRATGACNAQESDFS